MISKIEIRSRATAFASKWQAEFDEDAEAKSFWEDFFRVFGKERKEIAHFEYYVRRKFYGRPGFIDLFWPGTLLVEHKSRGKSLDAAFEQAVGYFDNLKDDEKPRYVLVSDFARMRLYDQQEGTQQEFSLAEFPAHTHLFDFVSGYASPKITDNGPVNIEAALLLGNLHDVLYKNMYRGHTLRQYMVRVLFCLFADYTGIFDRGRFYYCLDKYTKDDGSDVGSFLNLIFETLDTPETERQTTLEPDIAALPFVNGDLFRETLRAPVFKREGREALLTCCRFDWSQISPAIFGSLFQSVMDKDERRSLGAHYTDEANILKVIDDLFMNDLRAEYEQARKTTATLTHFHDKLTTLKFLDPACGCGNFLIVAYRELRLLEIEVIKDLNRYSGLLKPDSILSGAVTFPDLSRLNVHQFYGIEIGEFAVRVAEVALWMTDHQMNMALNAAMGGFCRRLPLRVSPHITHGNALELDWASLVPPHELSYIMGNPPFVGSKMMTKQQRAELTSVFPASDEVGVLDYVSAWYIKAAQYIQGTRIGCAFVSTNSISQGEQVAILWQPLLELGVRINFAHQTFRWTNEAPGKAAVYCCIIGFALWDKPQKYIYHYETPKTETPERHKAHNINPYLQDAPTLLITKRQSPLCPGIPAMSFGNMPLDGNHLLLTPAEKEALERHEPEAAKYIRPLISAKEYINGEERWCLWLADAQPADLRKLPLVYQRIEAVRKWRLDPERAPSTHKFAQTPHLFRDRRTPTSFIVIPRVSSEMREYIPMGFFNSNSIAGDTCMIVPHGTRYHFGILTSAMHMAWMRAVCGRLENRYRYSKFIVYNNFPWPVAPKPKQVAAVEAAAQAVLDARAAHPGNTLADLYDPAVMPLDLRKAHSALDKAVDRAYRPEPFANEAARLSLLFELYKMLTSG